MLRFQQPPEPDGFGKTVASAKAKIEHLRRADKTPRSKDFENKWGGYKPVLLAAQHMKCGYCEQKLGTHPGDVEHYRPKARLQELPEDKTLWGREAKDAFNVEGRKLKEVSELGYWWLAYTWSNYLAACNRCNSGWKRNLFPVEGPRMPLEPGRENEEIPLLLSPFGKEDPADHLVFDRLGLIKAKDSSHHGRATIDTCGLDRPSLVDARREKAARAHSLVRDYYGVKTAGERKKILADFVELGNESYIHAGMIRTIFQQEIGLPWAEVAHWVMRREDADSE